MNRSDLITAIANQFPQLRGDDAEIVVKTILDSISKTLAKGGRVEVRGFGIFSVRTRPPRESRNPKNGEKVMVGEKRAPHFKAGKELRHKVNNLSSIETISS